MPIRPIKFEQKADVVELVTKLEKLGIIQSEMTPEDIYSNLMKQLIVTTGGNTYLFDDVDKLTINDTQNMQFLVRNSPTPIEVWNVRASKRNDVLFNAPLAKALTQIYTSKEHDALFPLPVYEYFYNTPPIRPTITHIGTDALLFSDTNVFEDTIEPDGLVVNLAFEDLIWLRFKADDQVNKTNLLHADIQRMKTSINKQLEYCANMKSRCSKELSEAENQSFPFYTEMSQADLNTTLKECYDMQNSIKRKQNLTAASMGTGLGLGLIGALALSLVFLGPVGGLLLWAGVTVAVLGSAALIAYKLDSKANTELNALSTTENAVRKTWDFIQLRRKTQNQISKIGQREAFYKNRMELLESKEKTLNTSKEKVSVSLSTSPAALHQQPRSSASESELVIDTQNVQLMRKMGR